MLRSASCINASNSSAETLGSIVRVYWGRRARSRSGAAHRRRRRVAVAAALAAREELLRDRGQRRRGIGQRGQGVAQFGGGGAVGGPVVQAGVEDGPGRGVAVGQMA